MKSIKVESRENIIWVKLARPEKRNAFDPGMINELTLAFANTANARERAVVLLGEGESFCAGGDLEWMSSMATFTREENLRDSEKLFAMFETASKCPLPVIGRAHGHAMGGGLGLLAICDVVATETSTAFCFSEVKWGLVPAVISSFALEKMAPHKAREWMLTAKVFSAQEAVDAGLAHAHGTLAEVDAYVDLSLKLIKKAGPEAVRETKKLLRFAQGAGADDMRSYSIQLIADRRVSAEGQAGLRAFLEKKPLPWV